MKTIKILFACFFAVAIGIGVSGFQKDSKVPTGTEKALQSYWYEFVGNVNDPDEIKDASFYVYRAAQPDCDEGADICGVFAPGLAGTGLHPDEFIEDFQEELEDAYNNGTESSPNIVMKP